MSKLMADGVSPLYSYADGYLRLFNPDIGAPALRSARNSYGQRLLIKSWPDVATYSDLADLWQHELRKLRRIAASPQAGGTLARIATSWRDSAGAHLAIELGNRSLLVTPQGDEYELEQASPEDRGRTWGNLSRLAHGIEALHALGIAHGCLDRSAILTGNSEEPDFQLSGFEWASRIVRIRHSGIRDQGQLADRAFLQDWHDLHLLATDLLHLNQPGSEQSLSPHEFAVLHRLEFMTTLSEQSIVSDIDGVAASRALFSGSDAPRAHLVLPLGEDHAVTRSLCAVSPEPIAFDDVEAQREFIRVDLAEALAVGGRTRKKPFEFALRGKRLEYRLIDHRFRGRPSQWAIAECVSVSPAGRSSSRIVNQTRVTDITFGILSRSERIMDPVRGGDSWVALRRLVAPDIRSDNSRLSEDAVLLAIVLQYLIAASLEFPVEVLRPVRQVGISRRPQLKLRVRTRLDPARERLSELLGFRKPLGIRLHEALKGESRSAEDSWLLVADADDPDPNLPPTEWQFESVGNVPGAPYLFAGVKPVPDIRNGFLVPKFSAGAAKQLKRQLEAWRSYTENRGLQQLLANPGPLVRRTGDMVCPEDLTDLDEDKRKILQQLVMLEPLCLVQGPPGVGKTRLVASLVRRELKGASRLLLSAQSHAAVDHLLQEVVGRMAAKPEDERVIVRCRAREDKRRNGPFDVDCHIDRLLAQIVESQLFKDAPKGLREFTLSLAARTGPISGRYALEDLLLRSASLVFGTTNSGAIERLYRDGELFDWSLVEEAAKATCADMLNVLLLAPRRILVGDHQQLPPFASDSLEKLFKEPSAVSKLLFMVEGLGLRNLWNADVTALLREYGRDKPTPDNVLDVGKLCELSRAAVFLFESLFKSKTRQGSGTHETFAYTIGSQHRMHPSIAQVVTDAFYPGKLRTHPDCERRFVEEQSPVAFRGKDFHPILWVKTPWVSTSGKARAAGERYPAYHNPLEVETVARILWSLSPRVTAGDKQKKPSLAILSPYRQQVLALKRMLSKNASLRGHLRGFERIEDEYVHTVDSFQGNQADVVIISLVRNNSRGRLSSALGFLADTRRMNVLMSRAKWQLIMVGCHHFLQEALHRSRGGEYSRVAGSLFRMLQSIDRRRKRGYAKEISYDALEVVRP